jgi:hypothetical protein
MITKEEARKIAEQKVMFTLEYGNSPFEPWPHGAVGEPVLVYDVQGHPSYWLVPFMVDDCAAGFIRVLSSGRVFAVGTFCVHPEQLAKCPMVVTGITAEEALHLVRDSVKLKADETPAEPVFVHDGPFGREAWLVEISRGARPYRWIFVTQGGCYERPAGENLEERFEA